MKAFDHWNEVKKETKKDNVSFGFKNRDIFYIKMGQNIGYEQNGKGESFVRPVVILKGFNQNMFFGIPLSSQIKEGKFYYPFWFTKGDHLSMNIALLSQMRLFSSKRLLNKIGVMDKKSFKEMKTKFKTLID